MDWIRWVLHWLPEIAGAIAAVGIISAAIVKLYNRFIKPDWELRKKMQQLAAQAETILQQDKRIASIQGEFAAVHEMLTELVAQVRPNKGSSVIDIMRRMEARLMFISARQRLLNDEYKVAFFQTDSDGQLTHVSPAYGYLVSRPPEDLLMDGWKSHVSDRYLDNVDRHWEQAIREKRDFLMNIQFVNSRNGRSFMVEMKATAVRDGNQLYGFVGLIQEIIEPSPRLLPEGTSQ